MIIDINTDFLVKQSVSPNQYLILYSLLFRKEHIMRKLQKDNPEEFAESFKKLEDRNFIQDVGDTIVNYMVTLECRNIMEGGDMFDELIELFPPKVIRPNGQTDYLRTDKVRSRAKYKRLTRGRRDVHEWIMQCLEYEITHRKRTGGLPYMQKLPNWLSSEAWKEWGDRIKEENTLKIAGEEESKYGTELE